MTQTPDSGGDPQPVSQEQPIDTLNDRGVEDVLDEGISPPEKWSAGEGFGTTVDEQRQGESFDQRVAQEIPEPDPYAEVDDDVLDDGEVGTERAGRLVDPDEGTALDVDAELVGDDVGIDGAGSSAEEAAVHVVPEDDET